MPTGIALQDARARLFAAATRLLEREGAAGLTSRALTDEAGVAKGVLHRYFSDFDSFLAELLEDRIASMSAWYSALVDRTGEGELIDNVVDAVESFFRPPTMALISLVITNDRLRDRLRREFPTGGIPLLAPAVRGLSAYLEAERGIGRLRADAETGILALTIVGTGHLLHGGELGAEPDRAAVFEVMESILLPALP
ncbi:TetR/AcrR family transcriptional regulator [Rathayibacter sp. YIM 133350]|uniref:TetR/AcrR family transcriptional regulator n=1 Tax=Rathayibacter sp. YIM 133350 TaxID=3131992 RepID=UPI00307F05F4